MADVFFSMGKDLVLPEIGIAITKIRAALRSSEAANVFSYIKVKFNNVPAREELEARLDSIINNLPQTMPAQGVLAEAIMLCQDYYNAAITYYCFTDTLEAERDMVLDLLEKLQNNLQSLEAFHSKAEYIKFYTTLNDDTIDINLIITSIYTPSLVAKMGEIIKEKAEKFATSKINVHIFNSTMKEHPSFTKWWEYNVKRDGYTGKQYPNVCLHFYQVGFPSYPAMNLFARLNMSILKSHVKCLLAKQQHVVIVNEELTHGLDPCLVDMCNEITQVSAAQKRSWAKQLSLVFPLIMPGPMGEKIVLKTFCNEEIDLFELEFFTTLAHNLAVDSSRTTTALIDCLAQQHFSDTLIKFFHVLDTTDKYAELRTLNCYSRSRELQCRQQGMPLDRLDMFTRGHVGSMSLRYAFSGKVELPFSLVRAPKPKLLMFSQEPNNALAIGAPDDKDSAATKDKKRRIVGH